MHIIHICIYAYIYIYTYTYMYIHICIYIYHIKTSRNNNNTQHANRHIKQAYALTCSWLLGWSSLGAPEITAGAFTPEIHTPEIHTPEITYARDSYARDYRGQIHAAYALTANLRTYILDSRGFDSSINLNCKGWNSNVHRGLPGNFESTNLSRDNLSREIGRTSHKLPQSLEAGYKQQQLLDHRLKTNISLVIHYERRIISSFYEGGLPFTKVASIICSFYEGGLVLRTANFHTKHSQTKNLCVKIPRSLH